MPRVGVMDTEIYSLVITRTLVQRNLSPGRIGAEENYRDQWVAAFASHKYDASIHAAPWDQRTERWWRVRCGCFQLCGMSCALFHCPSLPLCPSIGGGFASISWLWLSCEISRWRRNHSISGATPTNDGLIQTIIRTRSNPTWDEGRAFSARLVYRPLSNPIWANSLDYLQSLSRQERTQLTIAFKALCSINL